MAKPIKATPDLVGKEADKFIKKMLAIEKSRMTYRDKQIVQNVVNVSNRLLKCRNNLWKFLRC